MKIHIENSAFFMKIVYNIEDDFTLLFRLDIKMYMVHT